jgi:hypothetical protein
MDEYRTKETIIAVIYWKGTRCLIQNHVNIVTDANWQTVTRGSMDIFLNNLLLSHLEKKESTYLLGPYMSKARDCMVLDLMCLTMINQATSWVEIVELPTTEVQVYPWATTS